METVLNAMWEGEIGLVLWLQSLGRWLEPPMHAVTTLGSQGLVLALAPLLFWCVHAGTGARVYLVVAGSSLVNGLFKALCHGARPYWFSPSVAALSTGTTFGLPSGHTQTAVALWGYLAAVLRRRWTWAAAGTVIALVAVSRLYLGVHFLTDVVAGLAVGVLLLWLALRYEEPLLRWWRGRALVRQVGLALAVSLLPGVAALAWQALVRPGWTTPAEWTGAMPPDAAGETLGYVFALGGGLFGALAGFSVLAARGWYSAEGTLTSRAARYVLGMAGTVLLFVVLRMALPSTGGAAGAFGEYAVHTLVALWGTLGAPELFLRTGLAERSGPVQRRHTSA